MYYADSLIKEIRKSSQIVVFGAGIVAFNAVNCLIRSPYQFKIEYCLVSDLGINPKQVMGIPVIDFGIAASVVRRDAVILIAVTDKNLAEVRGLLHCHGFLHTVSIAFHSDLWEQFRGNYFQEYCTSHRRRYRTLEGELAKAPLPAHREGDDCGVHVYAVRNHADKKLPGTAPDYSWERAIQAGAALTGERVCGLCDNCGDNISDKNKEYCELTALYWAWKNDVSDYAGLCHYRRHFKLDEEMLWKLKDSDIDVVLTVPILNFPSVRAVYRNDHVAGDWDVMLSAVGTLSPDYIRAADTVQNGQYYYGYNMFVARKRILDHYCEWLFPILAYCEKHCGKKGDVYQNRYIGFLAERLMTIYFIHHEKEYKIVHAQKHFIET